jgi:hypothetical protein
VALSFTPECQVAYSEMCDQKKPNDFFVCGFQDGTTTMDVVAKGRGGMQAMAAVLREKFESQVAVAGFRVTAVDDRGVTVSYRTKLILVIYQGPKMPVMKRAKITSYNSSFANQFKMTMTLQIDDVDSLSEENIEKKLRAAGGAHQPTSFDFTNETVDKSTSE